MATSELAGRTFYHVAGPHYQAGDDLMCWDRLIEAGIVTEDDWHWGEDAEIGFDGWAICVFETLDEARGFVRDFIDGTILRIDVPADYEPDGTYEPRHDRVGEGYICFERFIPARWLTAQEA